MKRLAVIAAVGHFNGHKNYNSTMTTTTTTTNTSSTMIATGISFEANTTAYNQNNGNSSPQIGGLGLLHQQNLRSGASGSFTVSSWSGGAPVMGGISSNSNSDGPNNLNRNVNVLLGGAMLSVVSTVLCVVCYCCHRNIKKRTEAAYRQRWMDNETNMEIYSVEQCYETSGLFIESSEGLSVPALSHEPPPSYDAVVAMHEERQTNRISPPPDYRSMNDVSGSSNTNGNPKFITGRNILGIKKDLSAQSCCSLQRAEAENLFQLGIAATATAASGRFGSSALGRKSLPYTAQHSTATNSNGSEGRILNQPYFQGCPLCGKFRYDDSMSLSSDSGLDQVVVAVDVTNGNSTAVGGDNETCYCTPLQSPTIDDRNNNVERRDSVPHENVDDRRRILQVSLSHAKNSAKCENVINNNNDGVGDDTPTAVTASTLSSSTSSALETTTTVETSAVSNYRGTQEDANNVTLDLDSINDNGIIRLDMSKIIDKTGLPTYEAALKLESSGYV